MKLQKCS